MYLSAKTNKKGNKGCPQVIGQPSIKKFSEHFKIPNEKRTHNGIKSFIYENIHTMLPEYFKYTFDCMIVYYNEKDDKILLVEPKERLGEIKRSFEPSEKVK